MSASYIHLNTVHGSIVSENRTRFIPYQIQFKIVGVLGNTEKEQDGYVVFKRNIQVSCLQQASGQIFRDDVNGFSSTLDI
jgi:hypothetical protein